MYKTLDKVYHRLSTEIRQSNIEPVNIKSSASNLFCSKFYLNRNHEYPVTIWRNRITGARRSNPPMVASLAGTGFSPGAFEGEKWGRRTALKPLPMGAFRCVG